MTLQYTQKRRTMTTGQEPNRIFPGPQIVDYGNLSIDTSDPGRVTVNAGGPEEIEAAEVRDLILQLTQWLSKTPNHD